MVRLNSESTVSQADFPLAYKWDSSVRRNYATYQHEIDKLSYHLQRVQRYLFVRPNSTVETQVPAHAAT